jgi:hypothetical protein
MKEILTAEEIIRVLFVVKNCGREGSEDMTYWENELKKVVGL